MRMNVNTDTPAHSIRAVLADVQLLSAFNALMSIVPSLFPACGLRCWSGCLSPVFCTLL